MHTMESRVLLRTFCLIFGLGAGEWPRAGAGERMALALGQQEPVGDALLFPPPEVGLEWEAWSRGWVWIWIFLCLPWRHQGRSHP